MFLSLLPLDGEHICQRGASVVSVDGWRSPENTLGSSSVGGREDEMS